MATSTTILGNPATAFQPEPATFNISDMLTSNLKSEDGDEHTVTNLTTEVVKTTTGPTPVEASKCSEKCIRVGKIVAAVVFGLGIVVGVIGLLVYLGQLNLGLTNVGFMSAPTGLYTMLGGFGASFVLGVLVAVNKGLDHLRAKKPAGADTQPLIVPGTSKEVLPPV